MREAPPAQVDGALAALVFFEALLEGVFADAPWSARLAVAGPAALMAVALLFRRREPLVSVGLGGVALALTGLLVFEVSNNLNGIYLAWLFCIYTMAGRETGVRLWIGVALAELGVVLITLATLDQNDLVPTLASGTVFFLVAPVLAGRLLHSRVRLSEALEAKAVRLESATRRPRRRGRGRRAHPDRGRTPRCGCPRPGRDDDPGRRRAPPGHARRHARRRRLRGDRDDGTRRARRAADAARRAPRRGGGRADARPAADAHVRWRSSPGAPGPRAWPSSSTCRASARPTSRPAST